jgi:hypothetical protein
MTTRNKTPYTTPLKTSLRAEIMILKTNKRRSGLSRPPSNMKQKHTLTHGHRSLEAGIKFLPPPRLAAVEEVVQAKLMEEQTRQARELNLKVRRLPLPLPSSYPMVIITSFLRDHLDLQDVTLDRTPLEPLMSPNSLSPIYMLRTDGIL